MHEDRLILQGPVRLQGNGKTCKYGDRGILDIGDAVKSPMTIDVLVLGAGSAGLGVADAAVAQGMRCCVIERNSAAGREVSNNSLRIIHGGFRYLQHLNLKRVCESVRAQHELVQRFPSLTQQLPCLMPLSGCGLKSRWPMHAGILFYAALARSVGARPPLGKIFSAAWVQEHVPVLSERCPKGVFQWQDIQLPDPASLADLLTTELRTKGADFRFDHSVEEISEKHGGVEVVCRSSTGIHSLQATCVVNTLGPQIHSPKIAIHGHRPLWPKTWCRVFNLRLKRLIDATFALGVSSPSGRLFFLVPRGSYSALGTGQLPITEHAEAKISEQEIENFLTDFARALPAAKVSLTDVDSVECGLLPALSANTERQSLYGSHQIQRWNRYIEVLSTKYTTFLPQGRQVLAEVQKALQSAKSPQ